MRKLLVAALMVLSFAGGTLFGQWTDIDFLGMVVEQANATLDTAHADGPGETAETTSDVSAPDPAPGASEPAVSEPVEEAATDTAPPPVDPVPDTEMPVPAASCHARPGRPFKANKSVDERSSTADAACAPRLKKTARSFDGTRESKRSTAPPQMAPGRSAIRKT